MDLFRKEVKFLIPKYKKQYKLEINTLTKKLNENIHIK